MTCSYTLVELGRDGRLRPLLWPGAASLTAVLDIDAAADGSLVVLDAAEGGFASVWRLAPGVPAVRLGPEIETGEPRAIAAAADGSVLVVDAALGTVTRIAAEGTSSTVATGLRRPSALDALPDGSFVVADTGNERVRRIAIDGSATTIAGGGRGWREGAAATAVRLGPVRVLRAATDGTLEIAGEHRLIRVARDGTAHTIARTASRSDALPITSRRLNTDGRQAADVTLGVVTEVETLPDGSVAVAEGERLALVSAGTARLAVAVSPRTRASLARGRVEIVASRAATARLRLTRAGRVVASRKVRLARGANRIRMPKPASAEPHLLQVTARDARGRVAGHRLSVIPAPRLSQRTLDRHLDVMERGFLTGDTDFRVHGCRRASARSFTCRETESDVEDDATRASRITLRRDGLLEYAWRDRRAVFEPRP